MTPSPERLHPGRPRQDLPAADASSTWFARRHCLLDEVRRRLLDEVCGLYRRLLDADFGRRGPKSNTAAAY
jgi:hypothetical protein